MASVQDHAPVVKELSDRRQQDPQPIQTSQTTPPKARDRVSDSPRPLTGTSETLQEPSPPRFSQLPPLPGTLPESNTPRRYPSTATNSATLANHPDTNTATGQISVGQSGTHHAPTTQDRNTSQFTSSAPDRRHSTLYYDPIRGDSATQVYREEGDPDRRNPLRRASVPRPRPTFYPVQDGTVSGNRRGSRGSPREGSAPDLPFPDPQEPDHPPQKTVRERLQPTVDDAEKEQLKYQKQARNQSLLINGAIGLQVVVGAITTGVAAASTNIGSAVAVLGGISTALASYLAKARGSGEPEFSNLRARELSTFLRDVNAYILDHGEESGPQFDPYITNYRQRFEIIIKTEGEDSTSGTGYANNYRHGPPGNFPPPNQQGMPGMWGGGNSQPAPPPGGGGYGYGPPLSEKQQMHWKNEKSLSGAV